MEGWLAGTWGTVGALVIEITDLLQVLQVKHKLPWKVHGGPSKGIYLLAAILRTALGFGVATLLGTFGQVAGGFGAAIAGMAAPKIIERLRTQEIASTPHHPGLPSNGFPAAPAQRQTSALPAPEQEGAHDAT